MQQTFLQEVAEKLYKQYGNSISELTIVLPSRRAQLFFSEALTHIVQGGAIWQPNYVSIDELMCEASSYKLGDKIRIVCELHKIYSNYHKETLDKFYFWGETLLSDFDLVDKYMVDADMLFCNLHDLKEIETHFPDDETWEVIRRFWQHFSQEETLPEHKEKFLNIWKSLGPVYHALRERLAELNFAYQGMVYRSAAENLESGIVRRRSLMPTYMLPLRKTEDLTCIRSLEKVATDIIQVHGNAKETPFPANTLTEAIGEVLIQWCSQTTTT